MHRDEHLLVVDKPHFLATIPRGRHIVETALVRLRRDLDLPDLSPAHRLDRATAGVLMFVVRRERRGAPTRRCSATAGCQDLRGGRAARPGAAAAADGAQPDRQGARGDPRPGGAAGRRTPRPTSSCWSTAAGWPATGSRPLTGRTHQLRLHMRGLGVPILGDDLYPEVRERALDDYRAPLQLLAAELAFTDPVTGAPHRFTARLRSRPGTACHPIRMAARSAGPVDPGVRGRPRSSRVRRRTRVLSVEAVGTLPVIIVFVVLGRQIVGGIIADAVKG